MIPPSLCNADHCTVVMIDVQGKLAAAMPDSEMQALTQRLSRLLQALPLLGVPLVITEQYPKGLGETLPELKALASQAAIVEKTSFSCLAEPTFARVLTTDRPQVVLTGMEAHICVLQTAMDLQAAGKQVFVLEDAVLSRHASNLSNALARMRQAGIIVSTTESFLFECLGRAQGDVFKQISKLIR